MSKFSMMVFSTIVAFLGSIIMLIGFSVISRKNSKENKDGWYYRFLLLIGASITFLSASCVFLIVEDIIKTF